MDRAQKIVYNKGLVLPVIGTNVSDRSLSCGMTAGDCLGDDSPGARVTKEEQTVEPLKLMIYWAGFGLSNILLGASVMMLVKGTLPNGRKVSPVLSTSIFVVGLTMLLVFGTPALLRDTLKVVFP